MSDIALLGGTTPTGGLPYPSPSDPVSGGADAIRALAEALDPAWTNLTLASGWAAEAGFTTLRYRVVAKMLQVQGTKLARSGSTLAINAGAVYVVGTFPVKPALSSVAAGGSLGVAGTLGSAGIYVDNNGQLIFQSMIVSGTMATGGGPGNHVAIPSFSIVIV